MPAVRKVQAASVQGRTQRAQAASMRPSISAAGLDPNHLPEADASKMDFDKASDGAKAWRDIWGAGQGIGAVKAVEPVSAIVDRLEREYQAARARLLG